uniref:Uncharacterized protein n=1 Tax=Aureoumbra lagunensis TaxID=44058 RepID=A0A7S3JZC8_9STRA|mmetsp:Transcript_2767/g.3811  ORF Transcript_2767/g.3811 Transcript_2767/m.3811 type:complete len:420 (+) Transcript_2767:177-1436(+)
MILFLFFLAGIGTCKEDIRFGVCITGQLRSGAMLEVQENLAIAVTRPLKAEVFAVLSLEHKLAHTDFHIPSHGCYQDIVKCAPRSGEDISEYELKKLRKQSPLSYDKYWSRRKPAIREAATEKDIEKLRQGPLRPIQIIVINDKDAQDNATSRFGPAHKKLFQRSLRARNRLCAQVIEDREKILDRRFDYIIRIRPDYAFRTCRFPPAEIWPKPQQDIPWATTHMDYFEVMTRTAADSLLKNVWSLHPPLACLVGQRVESCGFYALCQSGANVTAADALSLDGRDGRGTPLPGDLLRPCCRQDHIPRVLLKPPHERWCPLHRISYLQGWWYSNAKSKNITREIANGQLGPYCTKIPPDSISSTLDDDDDLLDDDDVLFPDDDSAYVTRPHEWWSPSTFLSSSFSSATMMANEELRRRRR